MSLKSCLASAGAISLALALQTMAEAETQTDAATADLVDLYTHLHNHPELSLQEDDTSALLADAMERLGFDVTTGLGDDWVKAKAERDQGGAIDEVGGYGVVGVMENGEGPTILIRADMDALPVNERTGLDYASDVTDVTWTGVDSGVMHACGHDIHMTSWIGTARELVSRKDEWSGTLVMILQPAEELGLGAQAMLADGLFERFPLPDYNLALHVSSATPAGTVSYSPGYAMANVDSVDIEVKGVGGHGAYPHTTKDPVLVAAHIVTALQTLVSRNLDPQTPGVVTVGAIEAGSKHNIISDVAHLKLTVRSYDDDTRDMLLSGIKRIAKGQAESFGAPEPEVVVESDYTPSTYNDPALTEKAVAAISGAIGAENVFEVSPVMGGEDFSQYGRTGHKIPSLLFWVGAVNPETYQKSQGTKLPLPSLHSPFFAPDAPPTIDTAVRAMTATAIDLFGES